MIPISKATKLVDRETGRLGSERVGLSQCVGRVLSQDIVADTDLPPFDRSMMDGFAVASRSTATAPVKLSVVGESAAGRGWHKAMKSGETVRIMTGAPVPKGADAVQRVELTREENGTVEILQPVKNGEAIVRKGAEIRTGTTIFSSGEIVTENMIAVLASFGYAKVTVSKQPRVGILATGSEIVEIARRPGRDQIRNSNSPMLRSLVERCGGIPDVFPTSGDDLSNLKSQISSAAKKKEILVITGGVSVGKYDLTKPALLGVGAEIFFEKVDLKPGKPTVFAKLGKTLVFGLPGNPVSAAVTFYLFVRMALLHMQGASSTQMRRGSATLGADAKAAKDRDTYVPAIFDTDKKGQLIARPLRSRGSSDFVGFARAEGLIFLKKGVRAKQDDVVTVVIM